MSVPTKSQQSREDHPNVAVHHKRLMETLQPCAARLRQGADLRRRVAALATGLALASAIPALASDNPYGPTAREIAHFKIYNEATQRVRAIGIDTEEASRLKDFIKAVAAQDFAKAQEIRGGIKDPVALKLVTWCRLRAGYGKIGEYKAWLGDNPAWPDAGMMVQRYEELLFAEGGSADRILDELIDHVPKTGMGTAALARAELESGDVAKAKEHAVKVWRDMFVPPLQEAPFLERFGKLLTLADHKWRLDRMMVEDIRFSADRAERLGAIRRQIGRLPAEEQKIAEARLTVFRHEEGALAQLDKVRYDAPSDLGLLYHRIQALRRAGKAPEAAQLMIASGPTDPKLTPSLDAWFEERRVLAYAMLNAGKAKLAYDLVKAPGPLSVNPAKDQAFLAGWLAMRQLKDMRAATVHFMTAAKFADGPLSRAKAGYWLGRIAESEGNIETARANYARSAVEIDTFHGQLSRLKLDPNNRKLEIKFPAPPSPEQIARFNSLDAVKAVVVASKAKLDPAIPRLLIASLRTYFKTEPEVGMTIHLADAIGDTQLAVKSAKQVAVLHLNQFVYSYPVHTFPKFDPINVSPEPAFLLGVARQETEFNKDTISGPGAKGLLQVMKVTAEQVCHDYKFSCELDRLLPDTAYNARMASAYIGDRIREFGGSYVLGLSSYNAGPGRTREWIRAFGDPRNAGVDAVDWIEHIPFLETREYVAKVLSNIQVYRARLGDEDNALQLDLDLNRGKAGKPQYSSPPAKPDAPKAAAGNGQNG